MKGNTLTKLETPVRVVDDSHSVASWGLFSAEPPRLIRLSHMWRLVALFGELESSCGSSEVMGAAMPIESVAS
ncbi:hypothetical protein [Nitratireductor aquibiodomus]|uniref:hypothetical protein n=1 Tax=Nitratireductor aquibiodomus TaxID=204799 RepID=UPI001FCAAC46|nr:hypothetical protein [Nitratireductor aquibiodomus]